MTSWLDILPASDRERLREKYKLSAAAYEKLRQKVKGPEDLREEMMRNEILAQLKFGLETEPSMVRALKSQIEKDIQEQGIEAVLKRTDLPEGIRSSVEAGKFDVTVASPSEDAPDQIVLVAEGNVQEKLAVKTSLADAYIAQIGDG